jgi:hypothetical protein
MVNTSEAVKLEPLSSEESVLFSPDGMGESNDLRAVKSFEDNLGGRDGGEKRVFVVFQKPDKKFYVLKISMWKGTATLSWLTLGEFYRQYEHMNDRETLGGPLF